MSVYRYTSYLVNDGKINKGSNISLFDFVIIFLNREKVSTSVPAFDFTLITRLKDDGLALYIILQSTELHLDIYSWGCYFS